jgi:hypothetical protein
MAKEYHTIGLEPEQKELLEETRDVLEEKNGYKPTQGETVAIACENLQAVVN